MHDAGNTQPPLTIYIPVVETVSWQGFLGTQEVEVAIEDRILARLSGRLPEHGGIEPSSAAPATDHAEPPKKSRFDDAIGY